MIKFSPIIYYSKCFTWTVSPSPTYLNRFAQPDVLDNLLYSFSYFMICFKELMWRNVVQVAYKEEGPLEILILLAP